MNWKSPIFNKLKDIESIRFLKYRVEGYKSNVFLIQLYSPGNSMYFRSFLYSLYTLLRFSDIGLYSIVVIVYGEVNEKQNEYFNVLERIGVEVYYEKKDFSSKWEFLLQPFVFTDRIVLLDVDVYLSQMFPLSKILETDCDYTYSNTRIHPKSMEELIYWKTEKDVDRFVDLVYTCPVIYNRFDSKEKFGYWLGTKDLWVGGYIVTLSERFYRNKELLELVRFFKTNNIKSDELLFKLAIELFDYTSELNNIKVSFAGDLGKVKNNSLIHWVPTFDMIDSNVEEMNKLCNE